LKDHLRENDVFDNIWSQSSTSKSENIVLRVDQLQWELLNKKRGNVTPMDLAELGRVASTGKKVGEIRFDNKTTSIVMRFPERRVATKEDISSLPINVSEKLIPLRALARVEFEDVPPSIYKVNGQSLIHIDGKPEHFNRHTGDASLARAKKIVSEWVQERKLKTALVDFPSIEFEDAEKEINEALKQLLVAVVLSIILIFLTLLLQFGDVMSSILVLVAIPLGLIGVIGSLFVFGSTLSLNSALGIILLNGISVANSILLVEVMRRLVKEGMSPIDAAVKAGQMRLRPILITSLTTVLGMMPIAMGFGEGGKILQPLGIAVSGGLWFSMITTLFVVPGLQFSYLSFRAGSKSRFIESDELGLSSESEELELSVNRSNDRLKRDPIRSKRDSHREKEVIRAEEEKLQS
jgi:multidrug efflux pump subunit AcrB